MFGKATITLGIGPHSSLGLGFVFVRLFALQLQPTTPFIIIT